MTDFGARGDGRADDTGAFRDAIAACSASGGGQVTVPAGVWLTGAIRLRSNVNLKLASGATLLFSGDSRLYPAVLTRYGGIECTNRSPMVYALDESNIALTGGGTLDASPATPRVRCWPPSTPRIPTCSASTRASSPATSTSLEVLDLHGGSLFDPSCGLRRLALSSSGYGA